MGAMRATRTARPGTRPTRSAIVALALLAAGALAGCGSDGGSTAAGGGDAAVSDSDAPKNNSATPAPTGKALAPDSAKPVTVTGYLVAKGDDVRLCASLAESMPPGCGGASLQVNGADLTRLELQRSGTAAWSTATLSMTGTIAGGVLTPTP